MSDELKRLAAPRAIELTEAINEQNELLALQGEFIGKIPELLNIQITLLDRLCTLKENQQESDDNFRDSWRNAKIFDTRVSLTVLFVAAAGVYFDVIEINSNGAVVTWLSTLFN